jgi:hypothetical protein
MNSMKRSYVACLAILTGFAYIPYALAETNSRANESHSLKTVGHVSKPETSASLVVINANSAELDGDKLVLNGVAASAIVFSERPQKAAGHLATGDLIEQWGQGPDNFNDDPPNATVSVLGPGKEPSDAVVTLKHPKLDGTTLTFEVSVLEGSLQGASGPAALFIDHWRGWRGAGLYGLGLASGAAIGAAILRPSPPPAPVYVSPEPYYEYPPVVPASCPAGYWLGPWGECRDTPYHGRLPNGGWQ